MKRLAIVLLCGCVCLAYAGRGAFAEPPGAEDIAPAPSEPGPVAPEKGKDKNGTLRSLHEGALFLLGHYAMLESCITANEQGRLENQAFLIGGASLAVPGTGQMINRDFLQGSLLLYSGMISWATVQQLGAEPRAMARNFQLRPWYYSALALRGLIMNYAMLQAANVSYREHRDRTAAMWTGAASMLPGAGQAVNGDWWEAAGFLASWILFAGLTSVWEREMRAPQDTPALSAQSGDELRCSPALLPNGGGLILSSEW